MVLMGVHTSNVVDEKGFLSGNFSACGGPQTQCCWPHTMRGSGEVLAVISYKPNHSLLGTKQHSACRTRTHAQAPQVSHGPPLSHKKKSDEEFHDWPSDSAASAAEEEATGVRFHRHRQRSELRKCQGVRGVGGVEAVSRSVKAVSRRCRGGVD